MSQLLKKNTTNVNEFFIKERIPIQCPEPILDGKAEFAAV